MSRIKSRALFVFFVFLFTIILTGLSSALTCEPEGMVEQVCFEIKDKPYNTTQPEIKLTFLESGVDLYNAALYRIGDIGSDYPENVTKIESTYESKGARLIDMEDDIYTYEPNVYLSDGNYMFRVDAENYPKNVRNISVFFVINTTGVKFWVIQPSHPLIGEDDKQKFAVSNEKTFYLELASERPINKCKFATTSPSGDSYAEAFDMFPYEFQTDTASGGRKFHVTFNISLIYPNFHEGNVYPLSIICNETAERYSFDTIYYGYDNSSPSISISALPNPITDSTSAFSIVKISTDDRTACTIYKRESNAKPIIVQDTYFDFSKFDEFVNDYEEKFVFAGTMNKFTWNYTANCTNLAGFSAKKNFSISLNMTDTQIYTFLSPAAYVKESDFLVNGTVTLGGTTVCTAALNESGPFTKLEQDEDNNVVYSKELSTPSKDGTHKVYVNCTYMHDYFSEREFIVDTKAPTAPNITAPLNSCSLERITARLKSTDNTSGIRRYHFNFTLLGDEDESIQRVSTDGKISYIIDGELLEGETYRLKAWAEDRAGHLSGTNYKDIKITNDSINACDFTPPTLKVNITNNNDSTKTIKITCTDKQSGCRSSFNYGLETNKSRNCNLSQIAVLGAPIQVLATATFCANVSDNNGNQETYEAEIRVNYPLTCTDGKKNGKETDLDCGGDCPRCTLNRTCSVNADCLANYCLNNKCKMPTCTDSVKNGNESGTDCGGNCAKCEIGGTCNIDADCKTSNCAGNRCREANCTDGKKDGTESDVDCGGTCDKCARGDLCTSILDCKTGYCDSAKHSCEINPALDTDNDELPDVWEEANCGSFTGCDPKGDLDDDGYTNLEEFLNGTDPLDEEDFPDFKKYNIYSIILLVIGILMILSGGIIKVMAITEEQKKQKEMEEAEMRKTLGQIPKMNAAGGYAAVEIPKLRELTPEEKIRGQQARLKALKSRDAVRRKLINEFDTAEEDKQVQPAVSKNIFGDKKETTAVAEKNPEAAKKIAPAEAKDEFVDLDSLKTTKSEDAFAKLKAIARPKPNTSPTAKPVPALTAQKKELKTETKSSPQKNPAKSGDEVFEKLNKITSSKKSARQSKN